MNLKAEQKAFSHFLVAPLPLSNFVVDILYRGRPYTSRAVGTTPRHIGA